MVGGGVVGYAGKYDPEADKVFKPKTGHHHGWYISGAVTEEYVLKLMRYVRKKDDSPQYINSLHESECIFFSFYAERLVIPEEAKYIESLALHASIKIVGSMGDELVSGKDY